MVIRAQYVIKAEDTILLVNLALPRYLALRTSFDTSTWEFLLDTTPQDQKHFVGQMVLLSYELLIIEFSDQALGCQIVQLELCQTVEFFKLEHIVPALLHLDLCLLYEDVQQLIQIKLQKASCWH